MRTACSMAQTPMLWNSLRAFLCVFLLCNPMGAAGDELALYRTSLHGSERLRVFALTRIFDQYPADPDVRNALRQGLRQLGEYYDGNGNRILRSDAWLYPVIGYDGNINGGVLNDHFRFGGLVFEADPAIRAKSGVVGGGGFGTMTRVALARGTFIDLTGTAEVSHSPEHDINRSQAEISACLRHNLARWTFVDLCRVFEEAQRELGRSTRRATRASLSSLHQIGGTYHETRIELERSDHNSVTQDAVTFGLRSVLNGVLPSVSISLAESVPNEIAFRSRVNAGIYVPYNGRLYGMFAWTQFADGGRFLNTLREDRTTGLGVSAEIHDDVTLAVTYASNRSTASFFNYEQLEFQLQFKNIRW